jgi:hypothetical protein
VRINSELKTFKKSELKSPKSLRSKNNKKNSALLQNIIQKMKSHLLRLVPVIESIEETKIIEDHHYSFVKFKDYEEQYNQWIPTH